MARKKYKFIDLFAGVGGIRIAFEKNSCKCVFSSEWDIYSQKTYFENFGEMPDGDITKVVENDIPNHNILTGGFPCQPFSTIGKRQGFDHPTQGTLFFDIVRILEAKKPEAFLLENVAGLVNHDGGKTFKQIIKTLENELHYKVESKVLDSADYGVAQHRKRIYIVGFSEKVSSSKEFKFEWPEKNKKKVGVGQFVEQHDSGYTISNHLQKSYIYKLPDGRPQVINEESDIQVKTLVSTYHKIQRLTGTFVSDGNTGLRLLSENECKAIMGFPLDFKFPVSRTQMYRQMGNSVAIPVVQKIAKQITTTLSTAGI
ncbi:DNA cytosine methyltransferase [Psychroflexus sp. MES1-P1E]|uniref:DNA cytosine methyltransferase n=1 Tax=Psychroflexus sp. MES1-P1E TaxID=2058320 RepID=UPI000C797B92|nr:DNA cytosine methyltransferase [Psychroflexus sp. MES1-P1E]PKG44174.1 DNA (cytosine-5-)-methyltransferase [Psychroflexus sp. MES1-P1E]